MPEYTVRDPKSGRTVTLRGATPPTEADLDQVFATLNAPKAAPTWADRAGLNQPTDSRVLGFVRGSGAAAVDMAEGAASGIASTMFHGGDLIRRAVGMQRVINTPEAQQAMRAPASVAGTIGKTGEQVAEFTVPLSRISKAASALPVLPRLAAEGAAGAGVAGVQSGGDRTLMAAGALAPAVFAGAGATARGARNLVGGMAAGARDGGIGGALASVVRSAAPVESKRMVVQALKPRNSQTGFERLLDQALPEIKAVEVETGKPIETLDDFLGAVKQAKQRVRATYDQIAGPRRAMGSTVDLSPVADAMEASLPKKTVLQDPSAVATVKRAADTYRQRFSLEDAEQLLRETNAELDAYYNKFPMARRAAESANPEVAHLVAQAKALRTAIYSTLDDASQGGSARELQRRYGALMEVEDTAMRRANVANRQQPESLSEQIGKVRAAADMAKGVWRLGHGDLSGAADIAGARAGRATATFLKEQQTTDALIRRAMAAHRTMPTPVPMPAPTVIRGELPPAVHRMGAGADPSYVRAVPGQYARREPAGLLPPKSSGPVMPASGKPPVLPAAPARPDSSSVKAVPAQPSAYEFVPARGETGRESWRMQPKSYSGDPNAPAASKAMTPENYETAQALRWIQADLENVRYESKRFNDPGNRMGGTLTVDGGSGGAPIYHAIVGQKMSASRGQVQTAIDELLQGTGKPSKLKQSILEVAHGLANGDKSLRKMMMLPPSAAQSAEDLARQHDETALARLMDEISKLGPPAGGREPGEEGKIAMRALLALGAGSAGAAAAAGAARNARGTRSPGR